MTMEARTGRAVRSRFSVASRKETRTYLNRAVSILYFSTRNPMMRSVMPRKRAAWAIGCGRGHLHSFHGHSLHLPRGCRRLSLLGSIVIGGDKKSYGEWHDLIPYAGFPFAAYGLLILGGVLLLHDTQRGLTFVAVGMLSLLAVAIRNSWAIAIGVVSTRPGRH